LKIIDGFIDDNTHENLYKLFISNQFPWYYNNKVLHESDETVLNNFQFTHIIYDNSNIQSTAINLLHPILDKLNIKNLLRIKVNLNPRTDTIFEHGLHTDIDKKAITGVYYLNTCNGYTKFIDGNKIYSVANRLVLFDSKIQHTGSTCTDSKLRLVMNINYETI